MSFTRLLTTRYRIVEYLAKVADPLSSLEKGVVRVTGTVHCGGEELEVTCYKGKPHITQIKLSRRDSVMKHGQELVFVGFGLDEAKLRDEVRHHFITHDSIVNDNTVVKERTRRPQITRESLQEVDINDINCSSHHKQLPEGWYFDGISYIYPYEQKSQSLRPDIDELIDEYLQTYNNQVDSFNSNIDAAEKDNRRE